MTYLDENPAPENRNFCSPLTTISTTLQIESLEESSVIHTKQRLLR